MLKPRIIPCLLINDGLLYKTVNFRNPAYIGDPLNAVRIFNEKKVDELIVLDISATKQGREPDYKLIGALASVCRMPLCYGGGVSDVSQLERIVSLGVEKVSVSSVLYDDPSFVSSASARVGAQSIVAVLDITKTGTMRKKYALTSRSASIKHRLPPLDFALSLQDSGVGEIVLNSVDRDGTLSGYDFDLIDLFANSLSVPLTVIGGASSFADFGSLFSRYGLIGAGAGSAFVFKGKYKAVLIQYPDPATKASLVLETSLRGKSTSCVV